MRIEAIAFRHRIPRDEGRGMRTEVVIYASAPLIEQAASCRESPGRASPCPISTRATVSRSAAWRPWTPIPAWSRRRRRVRHQLRRPPGANDAPRAGRAAEAHFLRGAFRRIFGDGATRAFLSGHREIPAGYRETIGNVCHGAGRLMSRTAVRKGKDAREEQRKLEERGILIRSENARRNSGGVTRSV